MNTAHRDVQYGEYFVKSYGWYESADAIFIAMEYAPLGDLESYLQTPFSAAEVRRIIYQILCSLLHMHSSGYTHRDLKPAVCTVSAGERC
jgi:serine/threonine protein kinase